ncbi:hypothetical protein APR11_004024 [Nocardia amikacinitolerans]|nr:hypothetical protein [Nocardia amikacinitolerans]
MLEIAAGNPTRFVPSALEETLTGKVPSMNVRGRQHSVRARRPPIPEGDIPHFLERPVSDRPSLAAHCRTDTDYSDMNRECHDGDVRNQVSNCEDLVVID